MLDSGETLTGSCVNVGGAHRVRYLFKNLVLATLQASLGQARRLGSHFCSRFAASTPKYSGVNIVGAFAGWWTGRIARNMALAGRISGDLRSTGLERGIFV